MTDTSSSWRFALNRRQAILSVSAAAFVVAINPADASAAAHFAARAEPTDMTGHVPAYNASIGFARLKTPTILIDDPYDLIFA